MTSPNFSNPNRGERKANRYGGKCTNCGGWVEADEGYLNGSAAGGWGVEHIQCPLLEVNAQPQVTNTQVHPTATEFEPNWVNGQMLRDGIYTFSSTMDGAHRTLRLKTQRSDEEFMPGVQIISILNGPNNQTDYKQVGHIKNSRASTWKANRETVVEADIQRFMALMTTSPEEVQQALNCYRCGALLTTPESIALGMGPKCSGMGI